MSRRSSLPALAGQIALAGAITFAVAQAAFGQAADRAVVNQGKMLAERHCGGCHAVERGKVSPLTDAPPMWTLYRRFPVDRMDQALEVGMLNDHPRMPDFNLDIDERKALTAYLSSFRPEGSQPKATVKGT